MDNFSDRLTLEGAGGQTGDTRSTSSPPPPEKICKKMRWNWCKPHFRSIACFVLWSRVSSAESAGRWPSIGGMTVFCPLQSWRGQFIGDYRGDHTINQCSHAPNPNNNNGDKKLSIQQRVSLLHHLLKINCRETLVFSLLFWKVESL